MKSIQSKILLVVISGLLIMTAVVSAIAVSMTHDIMHKDADRILNNVCQKEAAYINDVLGDIEKSAATMKHYATTELEGLEKLLDGEYRRFYLERAGKMFIDVALNTSGLEGFFMRINPEYSDGITGFHNLIAEDEEIKAMEMTDLTQYAADDIKNVGWYYTAVNAGKAVWLDPYIFPGHETYLISYVVPLYVNEKLLGVIGFNLDFEYLVERVNAINVYDRGYAVLLAKDEVTCYNAPEIAESHNPHTHADVALKNGMYLELRADYKDIQKEIRPMLGKIIYAFIVVLAVSIIYTILVTRKMIRPLKQLTCAAQRISEGVKDEKLLRVPVDSKDEIGTLSRVLVDTYAKIQDYTAYINALAYKDSLTGMKNNTAYAECVKGLNQEMNSGSPKFGVLVADINNLKKTNDNFGHEAGNELIIHTAETLSVLFKESEIFRIGGDEFAIILKGKDYENYDRLIGQMDEICQNDYIVAGGTLVPVSIARGVALFNPDSDRQYKDIFAKADQAMYIHKEHYKQKLIKDA